MPPIVAFVVGALGCEIIQLGLWWMIQPPLQRNLSAYRDGQAGHLIVLAGAGLVFCTLWALQGLDALVAYLPDALTGAWGKSGVPYTPQVGVIAGFILAFRGIDKIVAAFQARRAASPSP